MLSQLNIFRLYKATPYSVMYLTAFFFVAVLCPYTHAQEEIKINTTLDQYFRVKEAIQKKQLFSNEFYYEPGNLKIPNIEGYHRKETYYYARQANDALELAMVFIQIDSGKVHYDIELLYGEKEELIFCFEKQNNPQFHYRELKVFFEKNTLLRLIEGNAQITSSLMFYKDKIKFIQHTAEALQDKFKAYRRLME